MRGLAALAVLSAHARSLWFVDYGAAGSGGLAFRLFYFVTGLGHQAVMVFFCLSGFLVGGSLLRTWPSWSPSSYVAARLSRLWTVLIPAQLLCLLLDRAGIQLFGVSGVYGGNLLGAHFGPGAAVSERLGLVNWLGSVGFLQEIVTPAFGSNFVVWSVVCEFWFYALFPILLTAFTPGRLTARVVSALAFAAGLALLGGEYVLYFCYWLVGCAAWWLSQRQGAWGRRWLLPGYGVLAIALGLSKMQGSGIEHDLAMVVATAGLLCAVTRAPERRLSPVLARIWKALAERSYTLYAVHLPALFVVMAAMGRTQRAAPGLASIAGYVALLGGIGVYVFVVASITEMRTPAVRRWLESRLPHLPARADAVAQQRS